MVRSPGRLRVGGGRGTPVSESTAVGRHRVDRVAGDRAEIRATAQQVEALTRLFPGGGYAGVRSALLEFSAWVDSLAGQVGVVTPLRETGEGTREGIRRMVTNRGDGWRK